MADRGRLIVHGWSSPQRNIRASIDHPAFAGTEADRSVTRYGEGSSRCSRMIVESKDGLFAVIGVAFVIAVKEPRPNFSQIARPDSFTAQHTKRLRSGRPAIHQYESHVAPPNAKQNTVSDGCKTLGGGAQRWFLPSGLSLFRSTFSGGTAMYFPSSLRFA